MDGPILQPTGFRLGLSEGNLRTREIEFFQSLTGEKNNKVIIYSSRPLCGAYAQFLNSAGGIIERIQKSLSLPSDQMETQLRKQLIKVGIPPENIFAPVGLEAIFFPFYKWNEWIRLRLGRKIPLFENLNPSTAIVYMGDTKADRKIFQQIVEKFRDLQSKREIIDKFIQFRSSFPGGLF